MEELITSVRTDIYSDSAAKISVRGYGASGTLIGGKRLEPMNIDRNKPGSGEVLIEVLYCGVCHSDIHQVANDWKNTIYPCVPGHEVIGRITEVGEDVERFRQGQIVGVGCMIDSCRECEECLNGEEQYCLGEHGPTMTYNGYFQANGSKFNTFGGYSTHIVAKEDFLLEIPDTLDIKAVAPILCAGVTTYSPLNHYGIGEGDKVGIVGIGGLGHMAVMIATAMGAEVTAITSKEAKRDSALELGAEHVLISENKTEMIAAAKSLDFILVTIPEAFDVNDYVPLLITRGTLVTVGLLGPYKAPLNNMIVASAGVSVGGSLIGGIAETQEVLDFCASNGIIPETKLIPIQEINEAFDKVKNEEVRFRYVIDMQSLKA